MRRGLWSLSSPLPRPGQDVELMAVADGSTHQLLKGIRTFVRLRHNIEGGERVQETHDE